MAPVALRGLDDGSRLQLMVPDDLPLVRTDPGLLERVLANLFANALAYSPPRTRPELRASQDGGGVLLEIVDHGRGVPDELKAADVRALPAAGRPRGPAAGPIRRRHRRSASGWPWSRASWTSWAARSRRPTRRAAA